MQRLKKRSDFLHTARGVKWVTPAFVLQTRLANSLGPLPCGDTSAPLRDAGLETTGTEAAARLGFTASRKVGGAVARNFARRRLKEAARQVFPGKTRRAHDYVLIARRSIGAYRFSQIVDDLEKAIQKVHGRLDKSAINQTLTGIPDHSTPNRRPNM
ncbi:MAG: ribonuclease P protein component [Hyphomicrobiales bacterium]